MFTTPEIEAITRKPFEDTERGERLAEFGAYLDAFSEYGEFSVSNIHSPKPPYTMLARVDSKVAGFWNARITEPASGMRALGAFVGRDELVILTWDYRENLPDFDAAVADVVEVWRDFFGDVAPLVSENLDDHLTNYYQVA